MQICAMMIALDAIRHNVTVLKNGARLELEMMLMMIMVPVLRNVV